MALLKYVGNSPFGVSLVLHDMRTKITVSKDRPHKIEEKLSESDIRYYESIKSLCNIVVETTEEPTQAEVTEPVVEIEEVKVEVEVEVATEVQEDVTEPEVTKESIYDLLKPEMDNKLVDKMASDLGVKCKKRNKDAKLWEIIEATDIVKLLEYVGGN